MCVHFNDLFDSRVCIGRVKLERLAAPNPSFSRAAATRRNKTREVVLREAVS